MRRSGHVRRHGRDLRKRLNRGNRSRRECTLPTILAGATVTFNGIAAPLFYATSGQINAQVPFGIPTGAVSVQVRRGGLSSVAQTIQVAGVSPGIFTLNQQGTGDGAILHAANFQAVNAASPAQGNEFILIYCTGLGPTNPAVASGAAAPVNPPLAQTQSTPVVMIGGQAAEVTYSGMAPGFVGLYQINAKVPSGLPRGSQTLQVTLNGVPANPVTVPTQ